ncbi:hypothetical protein FKP32DRAFT_928708 [Trametes sanguinea]|nr:hypothetical protein FKP32DRAFT_928708 [Trametes sanguinea]
MRKTVLPFARSVLPEGVVLQGDVRIRSLAIASTSRERHFASWLASLRLVDLLPLSAPNSSVPGLLVSSQVAQSCQPLRAFPGMQRGFVKLHHPRRHSKAPLHALSVFHGDGVDWVALAAPVNSRGSLPRRFPRLGRGITCPTNCDAPSFSTAGVLVVTSLEGSAGHAGGCAVRRPVFCSSLRMLI